jgi:hypothetical protein
MENVLIGKKFAWPYACSKVEVRLSLRLDGVLQQ